MFAFGIIAALITGLTGHWVVAAVVGWGVSCITYLIWVWLLVGSMDAETTAQHSTREDPTRRVTDVLVLVSSLASLGAVVVLLIATQGHASNTEQVWTAVLSVMSVALSWFLVHTLFTLRYARLYYTGVDGGVDFNQDEPPVYSDFAYLSFTLGMTFQVSDTNLQTHDIRITALKHSLLSYLFGSVILASLINLLAGLPS